MIFDNIDFTEFVQAAGKLLDVAGIIVILGGAILATAWVVITFVRRKDVHHVYKTYRQNLARSILIGLEFLVAGDIIRSVAGTLSFESVGILAIIVAIRSLLGIEFEMEIEGRWPWAKSKKKEA